MARKNAILNASQDLTIDPGASGDSYIQFDINGTGEYRVGVDDDDGDTFKISQGSALGANDTFVMTASGERTMPLHPAFMAYASSADLSVTGDGTVFTLGSGSALTEVYDQGSDFVTTGTFTAPITGRFCFSLGIHMSNISDNNITEFVMRLVTSNATYELWKINSNNYKATGSNGKHVTSRTIECDMDASDTATFTVQGSGGTKVMHVSNTARNCFFSGFLMC